MHLIVLCGPPAVGKFSVARELARLSGYCVFHNHLVVDLLESLFEFGSSPFVELRERLWADLIVRAVDEGTEGVIFTLAFDQTLTPHFSTDLAAGFGRKEIDVSFVELKCSTVELERRIVAPNRMLFGKLASVQRYRELESSKAFLRIPIPTGATILDTTNISIEASASQIYHLLADHRAAG